MEKISVDLAIKKAHRMMTYPGLLVMFGLMALTFYVGIEDRYPVWLWPVGFSLSILLSWVIWSLNVTRWKVWAFERVDDVHELKRRAIEEKLIWNDESFFNRTEIWRRADKIQWKALQARFEEQDKLPFEDDLTVLPETMIYYAKGKNYIEMLFMIACFGIGVFFLLKLEMLVWGGLFTLIGAYFAYREFRQATNAEPQIILSNRGIQTISAPFCVWQDIHEEGVEISGWGEHTRHFLTYQYPGGYERLMIDDYDIEYKELRRLLKIYRGRSQRKSGLTSDRYTD